MYTNTNQIIERGMACLREHLGIIETEVFISTIQREKFDYTKWHQPFADNITEEAFRELCEKTAKEHPFNGKKATII